MIISQDGVSADPSKVQGIKDFPIPANITDLRSFFGLANQLGSFLPDLSGHLEPLRQLLRPKNSWVWTNELQKAFDQVKAILPAMDMWNVRSELSRILLRNSGTMADWTKTSSTWLFWSSETRPGFRMVYRHLNGSMVDELGLNFLLTQRITLDYLRLTFLRH